MVLENTSIVSSRFVNKFSTPEGVCHAQVDHVDVPVLATVTQEQRPEITQYKVEIATLRDDLARQESTIQKQDERMLQMEMALAELQRDQSSENQVVSRN